MPRVITGQAHSASEIVTGGNSSVEHAVGLTRRFWPKKTDYALIPDEEIAMVQYASRVALTT